MSRRGLRHKLSATRPEHCASSPWLPGPDPDSDGARARNPDPNRVPLQSGRARARQSLLSSLRLVASERRPGAGRDVEETGRVDGGEGRGL